MTVKNALLTVEIVLLIVTIMFNEYTKAKMGGKTPKYQ